ncbi:MAG: hypothetical protein DI539_02170 [Flavobacterium psychrophilum]|nr:MAG: hypothetical protein DI539_02170 [Flavobacterium psychrophilum]
MSCNSVKENASISDVIIGTALNEKYGAVVHANNEIYAIAGLKSWDSIYLNKKIKVKGHFKLMTDKDMVNIKNFGKFQAQSYSRYYLIEDATWELYDFN